jgi:hypothetical protein
MERAIAVPEVETTIPKLGGVVDDRGPSDM